MAESSETNEIGGSCEPFDSTIFREKPSTYCSQYLMARAHADTVSLSRQSIALQNSIQPGPLPLECFSNHSRRSSPMNPAIQVEAMPCSTNALKRFAFWSSCLSQL